VFSDDEAISLERYVFNTEGHVFSINSLGAHAADGDVSAEEGSLAAAAAAAAAVGQ
jgi:hypothetical protein